MRLIGQLLVPTLGHRYAIPKERMDIDRDSRQVLGVGIAIAHRTEKAGAHADDIE